MPILLKVAGGLVAGAMVGTLSFAFWPHLEPAVVNVRPAVEKPNFVTVAAVAATPASPRAAAIAAPDVNKAAIEKLAVALRGAPAQVGGAREAPALIATAINTAPGAGSSVAAALQLRAQGLVALAAGDIAIARAFLERAAEGGDARALLVLGDTYDPATLVRMGAVGLKGDAARARDYYARALAAGVVAARDRVAWRESQQN